jgi:TM2 domain-containing membrane protein YozV
MPDKNVWVIEDSKRPSISPQAATSRPLEKNPALAFSLSLLLWGGGQIYNRQRVLGLFFLLLMTIFYAILALAIQFWDFIAPFLKSSSIAPSDAFAAYGIFYLSGLIFWAFNALHAYYKASRTRTGPFQGIENRLLPPLCSLVIPGWGQFLNGQPKKGGFFLIFALVGHFVLAASLLIFLLWPALDADTDRLFLEQVLAVALLLSPLFLLMWGVGIYDALRVCVNPLKKEPLRKRVEYAINRIRIKGWKRGVIAQAKLTLLLSLFLVLSLSLGYYYFPQSYYVATLQDLQVQLTKQKMVLIPRLIDRFLQTISPEERRHSREASVEK